MKWIKKLLPISILIIGLILFFILGGHNYLSLDSLKDHYKELLVITNQHYIYSVLAFMAVYIICVAFSVPGATVLTLLGGLLFGAIFGTLWTVIAATIGATITFLAVQSAFGDILKNKVGSTLKKMQKGFSDDAFNYLIFLRLLPVFPFFIINIAAGIVAIPLRIFFVATFIGIIPGSFIYSWVGSGLGHILEKGTEINIRIIFEPKILLPIIGLGVISVLPVIYKKIKQSKGRSS